MKKYAVVIAGLLLTSVMLTGCNTIRGIGTDLKRGGEAIEGVGK